MNAPMLTLRLQSEPDIVATRQRARHIAGELGFDRIEQTRLATAVSEIARNAYVYAGGGRVEFVLEGDSAPQILMIRVIDSGKGIADLQKILNGEYRSPTGMGLGIAGARRLVDRFSIDSTPRGTTVTLARLLPSHVPVWRGADLKKLANSLAANEAGTLIGEILQQNRELLDTLRILRIRQEELERVNRELEDTNRGVVALYAELDERADHLRRADELKTRFLSNMTHEFRTPVNSILALTQLLNERLGLAEADRNEVFYIRKSAQQLSDLIDDLLDIAKVEAGKIEVRPSFFEVRALFGALRGMLRPLVVGQSLQLVFDDPVDLPLLYSDESKISQILRNFVSNALKYTDQGHVRVSANLVPQGIEFTVRDTGIGIPEEDLGRIFDEFVQIENPLQRRVKGTGLGLPLSRRLADLLGGTIEVQSTLGQGSAFTLRVPLVYRDALPITTPQPAPDSGRLPVLIVEDSDEDVMLYQRYLAGTPYQIIHARSAQAGLEAATRIKLAAIILDIRLYGEDSWDLLIRLKREAATADVPLIVASTLRDDRKAYGLGANAVAVKPIDRGWLLHTLAVLTGQAPPIHVLVVDDDEAFRFVMRGFLEGSEFRIREATNGAQALTDLNDAPADIVLLDVQMPGTNGIGMLEALKAGPHKQTPVIVVTSEPAKSLENKPLHGAARILAKSALSRDVLRLAVRDALTLGSAGKVSGT